MKLRAGYVTYARPSHQDQINNEMKIAYILDQFPRISETFISDEVYSVIDANVNTHVFAFGRPPSGEPVHERAQFVLQSNRVTYYKPASWLTDGLALLRLLLKHPILVLRTIFLALNGPDRWLARKSIGIADSVQKGRFTHIHSHFADYASQIAMWVHRLTGISFTFTTHRYDIFETPPKNMTILHEESQGMVCISYYNLKYLEETFNLNKAKLRVIRCGIYVQDFSNDIRVPSGDFTTNRKLQLLCVARLNPEKGHKFLLQALSFLRDSGIKFHLNLAGDGPLRQDLEALAKELRLQDSVSFLGAQSSLQVRQLFFACDIAVLASIDESMGLVNMEGMACGRPVIATRVLGVPELVSDKETGFLCPPGDSKAITDTICWIINHPKETYSIVAAGQRRVSDEFSRELCTRQLIDFWRKNK
jgi:glycosyltransferase involved in cell wall biosynthesis